MMEVDAHLIAMIIQGAILALGGAGWVRLRRMIREVVREELARMPCWPPARSGDDGRPVKGGCPKGVSVAAMAILALAGPSCGPAGKAVRMTGECQCTGTGRVVIEAGDLRLLDVQGR